MIIEKVEYGKEFPRCPDCGGVLYQESMALSHAQKAQQKIYDECDHAFPRGCSWKCTKCGYNPYWEPVLSARIMRCPKCAALYHVE